jgi:RNA polymerase sigma-70 factor (ECF subfamily)
MAQTALAKAWAARGSFETGTNLKAWLFTILRNEITTHHRRAWRQSVWDEDAAERIPAPSDQQEWSAELSDVACAMQRLPIVQREALVLVGAGGVTYQDAATICGVELGTMKSRVARARTALLEILDSDQKKPVMQRPQAGGAMKDILAQLSALTQRGPSIGAHV